MARSHNQAQIRKLVISVVFFLTVIFVQANASDLAVINLVTKEDAADRSLINLADSLVWKVRLGDDPQWAEPGFDDSGWNTIDLNGPQPDSLYNKIVWFRTRFLTDTSMAEESWYCWFFVYGAAELYINGILFDTFGQLPSEGKPLRRFTPYQDNRKFYIPVNTYFTDTITLAIRGNASKPGFLETFTLGDEMPFFIPTLVNHTQLAEANISYTRRSWMFAITGSVLILIALFHSFLFFRFRKDKANLLIALVNISLFLNLLAIFTDLVFDTFGLAFIVIRFYNWMIFWNLAFLLIPYTLAVLFDIRYREVYRHLLWLFPVFTAIGIIYGNARFSPLLAPSVSLLFNAYIIFQAARKKEQGWLIISFGFVGLIIISLLKFIFIASLAGGWSLWSWATITIAQYLILPVSLAIYMSDRTARTFSGLETMVGERTAALRQSLHDLKAAQTQLIHAEKMASLGELTAGIAHEIQNPLNFVNNFSEVSIEMIDEFREENISVETRHALSPGATNHDNDIEKIHEFSLQPNVFNTLTDIRQNLEKIHHHGQRADSIVKNMLLHSRTNTGNKEPTDINALADEYLRLAYHGLRAKDKSFNATFVTDFDNTIPRIEIVKQDMGRVLLNLFNNAFHAVDVKSPPTTSTQYTPTVTVTTKHHGDRIEIAVKDNGPGIPENIRNKIFQPFFTTKPAGQGTGLGLSLAYDIVKAHGGQILIDSREGIGTVFSIILKP